jgi:type IV secretion system protein TrbL
MVIAGSGLALSQALPDMGATLSTQAQVQIEATSGGQAASDVTYGAESYGAVAPASPGASLTGKQAALMSEMAGAGAIQTGGQAAAAPTSGAPASTGAATSGGQAAADPTYGAGAGAEASTGASQGGSGPAVDPTDDI